MTKPSHKIQDLHAIYVRLTGHSISLGFDRERAWFDFMARSFTAEDLSLVIEKIKSGIRKGERRPAALKFHNLIVNLDYFEEDLAEARARTRAPSVDANRAAVLRATGRSANAPSSASQPVSEIALKVLRDFKEGNK